MKESEDTYKKDHVVKEEKENIKTTSQESDKGNDKKRKLPSCFGFISTWIAKRKEKSREKKRKAIASCVPTPTLGKNYT